MSRSRPSSPDHTDAPAPAPALSAAKLATADPSRFAFERAVLYAVARFDAPAHQASLIGLTPDDFAAWEHRLAYRAICLVRAREVVDRHGPRLGLMVVRAAVRDVGFPPGLTRGQTRRLVAYLRRATDRPDEPETHGRPDLLTWADLHTRPADFARHVRAMRWRSTLAAHEAAMAGRAPTP